ncbi:MAG: hypothetical protein KF757_04520 [Phycisphaeraceae bacterium]|nr:hypothetical protein [Phycisphaeraceae bacterium]
MTNATTETAATTRTISSAELFNLISKDERNALRTSDGAEDKLKTHVVYSAWEDLKAFEHANREIERCRERIARECATLNPRRDSDCVSMDWIASATHDLAKAVEQRNAAHRRATSLLELMHRVGLLADAMVPDFNA